MERGLEDMSSILKVEDLVKYYGEGENQVRAVDHTSLQMRGNFRRKKMILWFQKEYWKH